MQCELCAFDLTHLSAVQMSIGLSNILRDMTQCQLWRNKDIVSISGNSQIKMSFCFIVEYLNVKVFWNFGDADTSYLHGLYHNHSQLRSSQYAHKRHIHKVQKLISLLLHSCQKYISLSPLTNLKPIY